MQPLDPLRFMLISLAGWMNRQQRDVIDYLQEENRILREQLGDKRLRLTDDQRSRVGVGLASEEKAQPESNTEEGRKQPGCDSEADRWDGNLHPSMLRLRKPKTYGAMGSYSAVRTF